MKKMLSKILVSVLIISAMPMHAGLGQSMHNGARTLLQGAGSNAGRIAAIAGGLTAITLLCVGYRAYCKDADALSLLQKQREFYINDPDYTDRFKPGGDLYVWIEVLERMPKEKKIVVPAVSLAAGTLVSGAAYCFFKACGWLGSRI